jgi:hypothetical protein
MRLLAQPHSINCPCGSAFPVRIGKKTIGTVY